MSGNRRDEWIVVTEDAKTVPVIEILTGRGFVTGKSGSGKSNTAGVIAEELLESGYNLLIVDTEGEYYGLKERYELLHVGGDEFADVEVGPTHAKKIANIAIKRNMPVILDVSGYFDSADAEELITNVLEHIYHLEKDERKPFLIMVEEMQEYLPQKGGGTELAELLERIAKRGRKRGLGLCGMSQRPSSVDKDFITQCDWMVWHRLTWETDLNVVRNILGSDRAKHVPDFGPGQGILMTDWDDAVETVQFKRKRTHDGGATPGLESYERPDLQTVGSELVQEIKGKGATANIRTNYPTDDEAEVEDVPATEDVPDQGPESVDDSMPDITMDTADAVSTDVPEELAIHQRQNEVLSAEIAELRSILNGVEGRESAPTVGPAQSDQSSVPIEPPIPPRRPPRREGMAGNIVEFCEMLIYLGKSALYRLRLQYYSYSK